MNAADSYIEEFRDLLISLDLGEIFDIDNLLVGGFPSPAEVMDKILQFFLLGAEDYLSLLAFFIAVIMFSVLIREVNEDLELPVNITAAAVIVLAVLNAGFFGDEGLLRGIDTVSVFVKAFVPIFAAVVALCGNLTMSGVYGAAALFCIELFSEINTEFLAPFINVLISVGVISGMGGSERFDAVSDFLRKLIVWCQCAMSGIILGIMSLNGFAAHGADTLIFKTGKMVSGAAIPVIGSTISSGFETVTACFSAASGVIGASAMLILCGLAAPLLLEILMFIMVVGISEVLCIFFDCEGVGKIFSVFKTSGVLILSSYIFELLVLVMGVALTLMIKS